MDAAPMPAFLLTVLAPPPLWLPFVDRNLTPVDATFPSSVEQACPYGVHLQAQGRGLAYQDAVRPGAGSPRARRGCPHAPRGPSGEAPSGDDCAVRSGGEEGEEVKESRRPPYLFDAFSIYTQVDLHGLCERECVVKLDGDGNGSRTILLNFVGRDQKLFSLSHFRDPNYHENQADLY